MKSNFVFFLGLFAALAVSWSAIVLGSNAQLGKLAPYYDDTQGNAFPEWMPGIAARGQRVYKDLGCAACHTQQVRRPDFGSDKDRGWGDRQSVARDYIYQPFPQLGLSRIGPDLANVADRKPTAMDEDDYLKMLYAGSDGMPSYRFLFEMRHIGSEAQPSDQALKLTGELEPRAGWEIVPTQRALDLVGYLLNSKTTYDYPEALPVVAPKPEGEKPAASKAAAPRAVGAASAPPVTPSFKGTQLPPAAANAATPPTPAPATPAEVAAAKAAAPSPAVSPTPTASESPSPTPTSTPTPTATGGAQ